MHQLSRRSFVAGAATVAGGIGLTQWPASATPADSVTLPFANGVRSVATYPQKRSMIVLTSRPVQLETPFAVFNDGTVTPNDSFFVRWHLAGVPTSIDPAAYRLSVHGLVSNPLTLSLDDLKNRYEPAEITAVCQCAGNSRGFFDPRVPGGQWGNGAMGNATWRGARLKDILAHAGVRSGAVQVRFNGMDKPVLPQTPDFMKSLDLDVANARRRARRVRDERQPLPLLNGFPARLVVPGWFATYWVKMLDDIEVLAQPDDNFWMKTAYRIPAAPCGCQEPGTKVPTVPISRLNVRSFITSVADGATVAAADRLDHPRHRVRRRDRHRKTCGSAATAARRGRELTRPRSRQVRLSRVDGELQSDRGQASTRCNRPPRRRTTAHATHDARVERIRATREM